MPNQTDGSRLRGGQRSPLDVLLGVESVADTWDNELTMGGRPPKTGEISPVSRAFLTQFAKDCNMGQKRAILAEALVARGILKTPVRSFYQVANTLATGGDGESVAGRRGGDSMFLRRGLRGAGLR